MDIIVRLEEPEYQRLLGDVRDFTKKEGWHFHTVKSLPKKLKIYGKGKIYFEHDRRLVGYGVVCHTEYVDSEYNAEFIGKLYLELGKTLVCWKEQNWYIQPYECNKIRKPQDWKYFNLKRWLGNREESEIVDIRYLIEKDKMERLKRYTETHKKGIEYDNILEHPLGEDI